MINEIMNSWISAENTNDADGDGGGFLPVFGAVVVVSAFGVAFTQYRRKVKKQRYKDWREEDGYLA